MTRAVVPRCFSDLGGVPGRAKGVRIELPAVLKWMPFHPLLSFAEWFLENASVVWMSAESDKKRRIQEAIFPSGVTVTTEGFGTRLLSSVFSVIQSEQDD